MRTSIYKNKIIELLKKKHLLSIADIHKHIPEADFSTIYRNVNQLLEEKAIRKLVVGNKSIEYESAFDSHDHFICNDCGKVESIHLHIDTSLLRQKVSDVTVRGTCTECAQ
jgi:Fe2+ or Zn2+ uptake regulation protein